jgi:uncharacterized RDD family membrane protein YckC
MSWYYKEGEQEIGPVDKAVLQQLIKAKQVNAKTLVRSVEMNQWRPLAEMVRGQSKAGPAPVPPRAHQDEIVPPPFRSGKDVPIQASPAESAAAPHDQDPPSHPQAGMDDAEAHETTSSVVCSQCGRSFPGDQVVSYEGRAICAACKPMFVQKLREGASLPAVLAYGGFWIRFLAKLIDGIILGIVQWVVMMPTSMLMAPSPGQSTEQFGSPGVFAILGFQVMLSILLPAVYNTFFIGRFGATLGKMACRLQVITPEGGKVSYARALGRFFAEMISYMILAIGYIMAAFDDEKRALHDRICSTRVVRKA